MANQPTNERSPRPQPIIAPSIDRVRLIRRSIRCGLFGGFGLIPVIGLGLAIQALRLHKQIAVECEGSSNGRTRAKYESIYWMLCLLAIWGCSRAAGLVVATALLLVFLVLQSWLLWRVLSSEPEVKSNPAEHYWRAGAVFGYGGVFVTLGVFGLAALAFGRAGL